MAMSSLARVALLAAVLVVGVADKEAKAPAKAEAAPELHENDKEPAHHHSKEHHSEDHLSEKHRSDEPSEPEHKENGDEKGEKQGNATQHGDGCQCECSWVSKDKKIDMCATDGDHSCCWHVCCKGFGGFTVTSTQTSSTSTVTTKTVTPTSTQTETTTRTSTQTSTRTETTTKTVTQTTTMTGTSTSTTKTSTTLTTTTKTTTITTTSSTTEYCFEDDHYWDPLDMTGVVATAEDDAFACQRKCLRTEHCSHFSFHKMTSLCHLQDAFAVQRSSQSGYLSGPFQCGSYIKADMFTKVRDNSYLPKEFRCMEPGVSYSPDMALPAHIQGNKSFVVKTCQQKCASTEGCHFFTVHLPGMCRLSGAGATPMPGMASVMSGPAKSDCEEDTALIMKDSLLRHGQQQISSEHHSASGAWPLAAATAAALLGAMAMGVAVARRRAPAAWSFDEADLEESLAGATSPTSPSGIE